MTPFWHPLSALRLVDPPSFATPAVLRWLLAAQGRTEVVYSGDAMAPQVRHGERVALEPLDREEVPAGEVVVACAEGAAPELFRVTRGSPDVLELRADAEPGRVVRLPRDAVLARALLPQRSVGEMGRRLARLRIDLREAWHGSPDAGAAETVLAKYDDQAAGYAATEREGSLGADVVRRIRERIREGGTLLVPGCGTGPECVLLAREGYRVRGVDFSAEMVRRARERAERHGLDITFAQADLVQHREPRGSLSGVVFTNDLYSLLSPEDRVAVLHGMAGWLEPGGAVFLSARRARRRWERGVLTLQWIRGSGTWGRSHTRYIATHGGFQRAFVQYFTMGRLRREVARAGFVIEDWAGGHGRLELVSGGRGRGPGGEGRA